MELILIVALGGALAGFVQGLSGFGFGLTAMALWAWTLEPKLAASLAVFGALVGQLLAAFTVRRGWDFKALLPFLDRTVEEVDPIERAVLRIAAYELVHRIDVPYRVVLNEAIETAKRFGSEHGHTYINGVLDHAAVEWRPAEAQARR